MTRASAAARGEAFVVAVAVVVSMGPGGVVGDWARGYGAVGWCGGYGFVCMYVIMFCFVVVDVRRWDVVVIVIVVAALWQRSL